MLLQHIRNLVRLNSRKADSLSQLQRLALPAACPSLDTTRSMSSTPAPQLHFIQVTSAGWDDALLGGDDQGGGSSQQLSHTGLILHGLLGQGKNWRTFAKQLADDVAGHTRRPCRVLLPDLRCHGGSAQHGNQSGPHTLEAAGGDVAGLVKEQCGSTPLAFMGGHSLGGKVLCKAVEALDADPGGRPLLPPSIWLLDSFPGQVQRPSDTDHVLDAVLALPSHLASRDELYAELAARGISKPTAMWLGSSTTVGADGKLAFVFDAQGAAQLYDQYCSVDAWHVPMAPPRGTTVRLVRAERSDQWGGSAGEKLQEVMRRHEEEYRPVLGYGALHVQQLGGAGHWLHVDNPKGLRQMMLQGILEDLGLPAP